MPKTTFLTAVLISFLVSLALPLTAQREINQRPDQQWIQYYGEGKINEHWVVFADAGFRWSNYFLIDSQFLLRGALGYHFDNGLTASAGYAYLGVYESDLLTGHEDRLYQELKYAHKVGRFALSHRLRVEERFFSINDIQSDELRFRYAINLKLLSIPLSKSNPQVKLDLNLGDEIFLVSGNKLLPNAFAQNRLIFSPNLHVSEDLSFALTWNRQLSATVLDSVFNATNVFWLQVRHTISF